MVEGVLSFAAGFLPRSSPPAGEEATALRPTTDELAPSASTEVAARPADKATSEEESAAAEAAEKGSFSPNSRDAFPPIYSDILYSYCAIKI